MPKSSDIAGRFWRFGGAVTGPFGGVGDAVSWSARYGFALATTLAALSLTLMLQQVQTGRPSLFLLFAAIVASAWFGGTGASLAALVISVPAGLYFYSASLSELANTDNVILLFLFGTCTLAGGLLSSWRRSADYALLQKAGQLQLVNDSLRTEIEERRRAEQALREAQAELAHADRLTTMGELTATIAHEINQPLTAITNSAGACIRWLNADPPNMFEARRAASWIARDAERAAEVVSRVRTMVRNASAERSRIELDPLIRNVLGFLEIDLRRRGVAVSADLAVKTPLLADRVQLQQVFQNLFQNAIDAMVHAASGPRRLSIRSQDVEDGLVVEIEDNGGGFEGEAESLFQPFFSTKRDGMGLGLSISRSIIESHGGALTARHCQHGACFRIHLPGAS